MIKLFLLSLAAMLAALAIYLLAGFPADLGYLFIAYGEYTFEASLFAVGLAVLAIWLVCRLALWFLGWLNPQHLRWVGRWHGGHRRARARSRSLAGMLSMARGDWRAAYKLLHRVSQDDDAGVVNYLAASCAAFAAGNLTEAMRCLDQAAQEHPADRTTVDALRARLLFKAGQLERCVAILEELKKTRGKDPILLKQLMQVHDRLQDWTKLEKLLPELIATRVLDEKAAQALRIRLFLAGLQRLADDRSQGRGQRAREINKRWLAAPVGIRDHEGVAPQVVDMLVACDGRAEAVRLIETALDRRWDNELISAYGLLDLQSNERQLRNAERWVKIRPTNKNLLLALARISRRNARWGKARYYYGIYVKQETSPAICEEYATLLEAQGDEPAAARQRLTMRQIISSTLPALPVPDPQPRHRESPPAATASGADGAVLPDGAPQAQAASPATRDKAKATLPDAQPQEAG